jgi:hypothetical protein
LTTAAKSLPLPTSEARKDERLVKSSNSVRVAKPSKEEAPQLDARSRVNDFDQQQQQQQQ